MIGLSFCKKQTNKQTKQTKEIGICPKGFFADVNTQIFEQKGGCLQSTPFQILSCRHRFFPHLRCKLESINLLQR